MEAELQEKRGFPIALAVGALVVVAAVAGLWFYSSTGARTASPRPLPFGLQEQQYAEHIHFRNFQMSRAENMLGQEITFIECALENAGAQTIREIEVVIEFRDPMNQVVLRETRRLFGSRTASLGGGRSRKVEFNFEHIPADWNQHPPALRVTGLQFEP